MTRFVISANEFIVGGSVVLLGLTLPTLVPFSPVVLSGLRAFSRQLSLPHQGRPPRVFDFRLEQSSSKDRRQDVERVGSFLLKDPLFSCLFSIFWLLLLSSKIATLPPCVAGILLEHPPATTALFFSRTPPFSPFATITFFFTFHIPQNSPCSLFRGT